MVIWRKARSKKISGGKLPVAREKKKRELGGEEVKVKIGSRRILIKRTRGGGRKVKALSIDFANLYDPETKRCEKVKILGVEENPASRHFVRMGVITKGAIIKTSKGLAKVTNRPSQEGFVNAILLKKEE
ncbi:MAG TPA: 30S ribosomal protein S8e [Candidatus Aenigmarchaeota archaeon]|nr:30S ribosomal protein S8e [Candidatus Aenigmarchaeota archaeon]